MSSYNEAFRQKVRALNQQPTLSQDDIWSLLRLAALMYENRLQVRQQITTHIPESTVVAHQYVTELTKSPNQSSHQDLEASTNPYLNYQTLITVYALALDAENQGERERETVAIWLKAVEALMGQTIFAESTLEQHNQVKLGLAVISEMNPSQTVLVALMVTALEINFLKTHGAQLGYTNEAHLANILEMYDNLLEDTFKISDPRQRLEQVEVRLSQKNSLNFYDLQTLLSAHERALEKHRQELISPTGNQASVKQVNSVRLEQQSRILEQAMAQWTKGDFLSALGYLVTQVIKAASEEDSQKIELYVRSVETLGLHPLFIGENLEILMDKYERAVAAFSKQIRVASQGQTMVTRAENPVLVSMDIQLAAIRLQKANLEVQIGQAYETTGKKKKKPKMKPSGHHHRPTPSMEEPSTPESLLKAFSEKVALFKRLVMPKNN